MKQKHNTKPQENTKPSPQKTQQKTQKQETKK